jgi:tetratricopeptide (TPR) repeat protein
MKSLNVMRRLVPALALALILSAGTFAQETAPPPPPVEDNGDSRAEYAALVEEAEASAALGTAEAHIAAGDLYVRAADLARDSGDEELAAIADGARQAAVRSFVDAGSAYAGEQQFTEAGTIFGRAADIAAELGDEQLQARVTANAGTAYIQAQDFGAAVEHFSVARELNPENLDYAYLHAVALRGTGDTEAALQAFAQVAAAAEAAGDDDNLAKANEAAGRMHLMSARDAIQAQDFRGAIAALDQAAQFLPEDDGNLNTFYANAYYRQGVAQVQAQQWAPARTSLQRAQQHARVAGRDQIVQGAQQQLDYVQQMMNQ